LERERKWQEELSKTPRGADESQRAGIQGYLLLRRSGSIRAEEEGSKLMAVVRRIGPGSAFKIGLVLYAVLGLIVGICFALFAMLGGALTSMTHSPSATGAGFMFGFGIGAVIAFPIMYGIIGGVTAAISALIYNLVAGWVGGLEVDIS